MPPLAAAFAALAVCRCSRCAVLSALRTDSSSAWLLLSAWRFSSASISFCLLYICIEI